jgi:hypothetical protein
MAGQQWRQERRADGRNRTGDFILTRDALYQLSYVGGALGPS